MQQLNLGSNAYEQWYTLVLDAEKALGCKLSEDLEHYLVALLQGFLEKPDVVKSIIALEYLESQHKLGVQQQDQLRAVGDKCLLFSGLFPDVATRRRVSLSYFVELGQQAYYLLSIADHFALADLYHSLELNFVSLMDTLQCMRELAGKQWSISPVQAQELWRATGSRHALQILRRYTKLQ